MNDRLVLSGGKRLRRYASYDRILDFLSVLKMQDLDEADKETVSFAILFGGARLTGKEKQEAMEEVRERLFPDSGDGSGQKTFDFEQDKDAIFASFFQVYGIDLEKARGQLHWLHFVALLNGLFMGPKCTLSQLVYIRTCPIPKPTKHNQDQIQSIMQAKAKCRLKLTPEEEQAQYQRSLQRLAANLMGGVRRG